MSDGAEELLLKHEINRQAAMQKAKTAADRISLMTTQVSHHATFVALDLDELARYVATLRATQAMVIEASAKIRQYMKEAVG